MHIENFLEELYKKISEYGYFQLKLEDNILQAKVDETAIFGVNEKGIVHFEQDATNDARFEKLKERVLRDIDMIKEYLNMMDRSTYLQAVKLNRPYKKLSEHNGVVLLGIYNEKEKEYEFSIWKYRDLYLTDADYSLNYNSAKERFLQRSGLIKGKIYFIEEEYLEIYKSIDDYIDGGNDISEERLYRLKDIQIRISHSIKDFDTKLQRLNDFTDETTLELML